MKHDQYYWYQQLGRCNLLAKSWWMDRPDEYNEKMWENLLLAAEAQWEVDHIENRYRKTTTPRQAEQQKLAGQLRMITGMIGQAKHLRYTGNGMVFCPLDRVQNDLNQVVHSLRYLLSNIKERIPA